MSTVQELEEELEAVTTQRNFYFEEWTRANEAMAELHVNIKLRDDLIRNIEEAFQNNPTNDNDTVLLTIQALLAEFEMSKVGTG